MGGIFSSLKAHIVNLCTLPLCRDWELQNAHSDPQNRARAQATKRHFDGLFKVQKIMYEGTGTGYISNASTIFALSPISLTFQNPTG